MSIVSANPGLLQFTFDANGEVTGVHLRLDVADDNPILGNYQFPDSPSLPAAALSPGQIAAIKEIAATLARPARTKLDTGYAARLAAETRLRAVAPD